MTDYREINALQHDLHRARRLAEFLLLIVGAEWNEWETTFLNSIIRQVDERLASPDKERRKDPLSTRQVEILVELRDDSILYGKAEGFSIPSLIAGCFEMQHLLNERELEFIKRHKDAKTTQLRRRQVLFLFHCARKAMVIEPYMGWKAGPVEDAA
jgi:hypothetical protein